MTGYLPYSHELQRMHKNKYIIEKGEELIEVM
jgi:hypothetical protein